MPVKHRGRSRLVLVLLSALALCLSVLALPAAAVPPAAPVLTLTPTASSIGVSWATPDAGAGESITGYSISISPVPAGVTSPAPLAATATSYLYSGLAASTTYTVTLVATSTSAVPNTSQDADPTTTLAAPASAPAAPTGVTITKSGTNTGVVTWINGAANGSTVTGHTVILSATAGGVATNTQTAAAGAATLSFPGLAAGTYFARVQTISSDQGNSAATQSGGSITVAAVATIPTPPSAVSAVAAGGQITVTFTAPLATDSSAATSYNIRLLGPDGTPLQTINRSNAEVGITTGDSEGTHTFTTTDSGQYSVDVAAVNAAGSSTPPTKSTAFTVAIAPSVPQNVSASTTGDTVTVNWTAPATTGGAIDHYEVKVGATTTIVPAPATTVTVSGLAAGTYTPTVTAVNTVPLSSAAASANEVTVVVPPGAPTAVTGTATGQSVLVKWTAPANSGGSPVLNYKVTLNGVTTTVTGGVQTTFANVPYGKYVATVSATTAAGDGPVASSPEFLVARDFQPFDSDDAFVSQLYKDILGRSADTGGRDYWAGIVANNRNNVPTVVKQFLSSPEFGPREPIIRLYLAYFNRAPDSGGFDYWTNLYVQKRINLTEASYYFSTSPEFIQTYGNLSDGQFIVLVYNNVLGRSPDIGGYNHWVTQLSSGLSRNQLMVEFSESPEFLTSSRNFVDITMVHRGMLNRIPNVSTANNEYNIWLPRLAGADDVDDLIMDIFDSDEYAGRVTP